MYQKILDCSNKSYLNSFLQNILIYVSYSCRTSLGNILNDSGSIKRTAFHKNI